jgi:hypothetical protein
MGAMARLGQLATFRADMNVSQAVGSGGANKAATMFQKPLRSAQRKLLNSNTQNSSYAAFQKQMFLEARSNELFVSSVGQSKV